jgi:hypothetical protein
MTSSKYLLEVLTTNTLGSRLALQKNSDLADTRRFAVFRFVIGNTD